MGKRVGFLSALVLMACSGESVPTLSPPERAGRIQRIQQTRSPAHAFRTQGDEAVAHNALGFSVRVTPDRLELSHGAQKLRLSWTAIGRAGAMQAPHAATGVHVNGQRVERSHAADRAWFVNGPLGVEHGFEIASRPSGSGALLLALRLDGLTALRGRYTDLHVVDARGRTLPSRIVRDHDAVALRIDDTGASYPIAIDPLLWLDTGKLEPLPTAFYERFGFDAAVSGDTVVIGARQNVGGNPPPETGAAYVFVESGTGWAEQDQLQPSDGDLFDSLGYGVAIDGDTLVAGAPAHEHGAISSGAAYVFVRNGTTWSEQAELLASNPQDSSFFGDFVAIDGDTILVAATGGVNTVYVFTRSGGVWTEVAELQPAVPPTILYPTGLALSGDTAVVGDPGDDLVSGLNRGSAYVFTGSGASWTEQPKLTSPQVIYDNTRFGTSVDVDGDTIVVGAPFASIGLSNFGGAAAVFTRSAGVWTQERWLVGSDSADGDGFGLEVAVDGDLIAVGAPGHDALATNGGAAYVFTRSGGLWPEQLKIVAPDAGDDDEYGASVAVGGNTVVASSSTVGEFDNGAARVFRLVSTGQACGNDGECPTGHCVDGVCCNEACGGDSQEDCLACAESLSGLPDGVCGVALDGVTCLQDDLFCNGVESCSSGLCMSEGDPCLPAAGNGNCSDLCNEDEDACTAPEPDNTPCFDGLDCTAADHCESGVCVGTDPCVDAADGDADCNESCDEATGTCTAPDEDGASCADRGICRAGTCLAGPGAVCDAGDVCASEICTDGICCTEPSCDPYRCGDTGECLTGCTDTSDCQQGHQCSAAGSCDLIADFELTDDGCSCSAVGRRDAYPAWLWLGALLLAGRRRRRCGR